MTMTKADKNYWSIHILLWSTLMVFTYVSFYLLYLLFLNPGFLNRLDFIAPLICIASLAVGAVLMTFTAAVRLLGSLKDIRFRLCGFLMYVSLILILLGTIVLLFLPAGFPAPVTNLRVLALIPLLFVITLPLWKLISRSDISPIKLFGFKFLIPAALLVSAISWAAVSPHFMKSRTKVVVIGIDGATMRIIDRLASQGELPNISRMLNGGSSGLLDSIDPCLSPAVWTSISTGFLPESHGIKNFNGTQDKVKKKGFWEILSENGKRVGSYKWLVTWPPVEVNGFVVPNWLARDSACYPPQLSHIKRVSGKRGLRHVMNILLDVSYGLTADGVLHIIAGKMKAMTSGVPEIERNITGEQLEAVKRRDYFIRLKRIYDVDYASCVFDGVDNFSHTLWQYMEPGKFESVPGSFVEEYGGVIEGHYHELDRYIGEITRTLEDSTYVMVISDHGFQSADTVRHHSPKPRESVLTYLDLSLDLIQTSGYQFEKLFLGIKKGDGAEEIAGKLEDQLKSIVLEGEEIPLLSVHRFEKKIRNYNTVIMIRAREGLTFMNDRTVILPVGKAKFQDIFSLVPPVSGDHDPDDGIFIFAGPGVRQGYKVKGLSALDIHPLILYLYGLEVPLDIDGKLRMDLFEENWASHPVFKHSYGERIIGKQKEAPMSKEALERMRALGYIE